MPSQPTNTRRLSRTSFSRISLCRPSLFRLPSPSFEGPEVDGRNLSLLHVGNPYASSFIRKSPPPMLKTPSPAINSCPIQTPVLWSVPSDLTPEPMDISPDKAPSPPLQEVSPFPEAKSISLALRRQGPAVSAKSATFCHLKGFKAGKAASLADQEALEVADKWQNPAVKAWEKPLVKAWEKPLVKAWEKQAVKAWEKPAVKAWEKPAVKVQGQRSSGRGWLSWCCIMILELIAGTSVVVAAMLGTDVFGFWCEHYKSFNTTSLSLTLNEHVFGQHIAIQIIPTVIEEHLQRSALYPQKALVLSFHGWTGVGKNHISLLIDRQLRRGEVNKIISTLHFPHAHLDYTAALEGMILPKLSRCNFNVFLIDEINNAPASVIRALKVILRKMKSNQFQKENYRVMFLLLSNTGASVINQHLLHTLRVGEQSREMITHDELVNVLLEAQYRNAAADFSWFTQLHNEDLIDVVVPFLPLEKKHVAECASADMDSKGIYPNERAIQRVLREIKFVPEDNPIFSASGCRQVRVKVDLVQ